MEATEKPDSGSRDDKPRNRKRDKFLRLFKPTKRIEAQVQQDDGIYVYHPI